MADPTMQTFCCHRGNATDVAVTLMKNLNIHTYNIVCIISSTLGICGGLYQILPRKHYAKSQNWLSFSTVKGRRIIVWLAVSDLLASLAILIRSVVWLKFHNIMPCVDDQLGKIFCIISSGLVQYFYTATWIWTFCYALNMQLVLREKEFSTKYYHLSAWIIPFFTTTFGLSFLYFPDLNCHVSKSLLAIITRILPNYIVNYIPIALVMIYNPFLYCRSTKDMERIITSVSGQFTSREREIIEGVKTKFFVMNLVFYICWTPNVINGILLWILWFDVPLSFISVVWYIMAFLNPLQALLNSLVYRRWSRGSEKIILPWNRTHQAQNRGNHEVINSSLERQELDEKMPLLRNASPSSNQVI